MDNNNDNGKKKGSRHTHTSMQKREQQCVYLFRLGRTSKGAPLRLSLVHTACWGRCPCGALSGRGPRSARVPVCAPRFGRSGSWCALPWPSLRCHASAPELGARGELRSKAAAQGAEVWARGSAPRASGVREDTDGEGLERRPAGRSEAPMGCLPSSEPRAPSLVGEDPSVPCPARLGGPLTPQPCAKQPA